MFKDFVNRCAAGHQACGLWTQSGHTSDFNGQHMEQVSDEQRSAGDRCWVIHRSDPPASEQTESEDTFIQEA